LLKGIEEASRKPSQQSLQDLDTLLGKKDAAATVPAPRPASTVPGLTVLPPAAPQIATPPIATPADGQFATADLALRQQALVAVWPGFTELRHLRTREYDTALASVPLRNGVTDTNAGIAVMSAALAQTVKLNLQNLMKLDDKEAVDLIRSQVAIYAGIESEMGEEFCGRSVQNDLGPFASQTYLLPHASQIMTIVKSNLDQLLKIIRAQEAHKGDTLRTVPTSLDLAPYSSDLVAVQTYRGTRQYDKICGAVKAFLTKVVADKSVGAPKARIMALVAIQ
jgi:hypothetical protein